MAFVVKLRHFNGWKIEKTFSVEEINPYLKESIIDKQFRIETLTADGNELEFVRNKFDRTPITKDGPCVWHSEYANFIFNNL